MADEERVGRQRRVGGGGWVVKSASLRDSSEFSLLGRR